MTVRQVPFIACARKRPEEAFYEIFSYQCSFNLSLATSLLKLEAFLKIQLGWHAEMAEEVGDEA